MNDEKAKKDVDFTKKNIDEYLKEVAKVYRKLAGKRMPAEIILIGGASALINYGFRNATTDVDAILHGSSAMKEAINNVGDRFGLPNGWLNDDFKKTESYSPKIDLYSEYYRTYSNVLTIRTVSAEYLVAMKLMSGRQYKHDLSDVLGILADHQRQNKPISLDMVKQAAINLYESWEIIPEESRNFIVDVFNKGRYEQRYEEIAAEEKAASDYLIKFEKDYPGVAKASNVNEILARLKEKKAAKEQVEERSSLMANLKEKQRQAQELEADNQ